MSSKYYNSSIKDEKNIFNTKGKAFKKAAKDVAKVCSQKALQNGSTVLDYNPPSNRCANLFKFGADVHTGLAAKHFQKHGNPSYVDGGCDRKSIKKQEAEASFSVLQSSLNVDEDDEDVFKSLTINPHQMMLCVYKRSVDCAEEDVRRTEKAMEETIKLVSYSKDFAEMRRKNADDFRESLRNASLLGHPLSDRILKSLKKSVDHAEKAVRIDEKAVERAIELAASAKVTAEMARKDAVDFEESLRTASLLEEAARSKEKAERAIECSSGSKVTAKRHHETAESAEISLKRLKRERCINFSRNDMQIVKLEK